MKQTKVQTILKGKVSFKSILTLLLKRGKKLLLEEKFAIVFCFFIIIILCCSLAFPAVPLLSEYQHQTSWPGTETCLHRSLLVYPKANLIQKI